MDDSHVKAQAKCSQLGSGSHLSQNRSNSDEDECSDTLRENFQGLESIKNVLYCKGWPSEALLKCRGLG
jgi:hypothetical protein